MPRPTRRFLVVALTAVLAAALALPAAAGPPLPPGKPAPSGIDVTWDAACDATVDLVVSTAGPRVTEVVVQHDGTQALVEPDGRWLNGMATEVVLSPGGDGPDRTVQVTMHDRRGRVVWEASSTGSCEGSGGGGLPRPV